MVRFLRDVSLRSIHSARFREYVPAWREWLILVHDSVIRFLLPCEGTSDRALVPHLRRLPSHCGEEDGTYRRTPSITSGRGP